MTKSHSLMILISIPLISGCATYSEINQAKNEPICWGNITAKSSNYEISPIMEIGSFGDPFSIVAVLMKSSIFLATLPWNAASRTLHAAAATVNNLKRNPGCYFKDKSSEEKSLDKKSNSTNP